MEVKICKYVPRTFTGFPQISSGSYWISPLKIPSDFLGIPSDILEIPSDFLGIPSDFLGIPPISTGIPGFLSECQDFDWNSTRITRQFVHRISRVVTHCKPFHVGLVLFIEQSDYKINILKHKSKG